jgi:hypothetical protein
MHSFAFSPNVTCVRLCLPKFSLWITTLQARN